ncbi:MAG: Rrf2 family transcriptional regulator [Clostridia bacterium]|nr:Rrf2 family transcriptional regulator [Clostridia bacterium]
MMISTRGRYALRVMIDLAGQDPDIFVPLRDIAERQNISEKYLESVIKALVSEGLLCGMRGKGGGYKLPQSPEHYSVGTILRLTEGTLAPVACLECNGESECDRSHECPTLPLWQKLDELIGSYLDSISLADLINKNL